MAEEIINQGGGNTEHVVKLITEPPTINPQAIDNGEFDEQKFKGLYQRFAPEIEKTLGIDRLKEEFQAALTREAEKDMLNARLHAQTKYGFTDEEITEIPGDTADQFAKAAAAAGKYKTAATESSRQVQDAQNRGILPSELAGGTEDIPKEGTREYGIYILRKAQGLVK